MDPEGPSIGNGRPAPPSFTGSSLGGANLEQQSTNYTIPGILHFVKHEWSRFEKERASWDVERTELQAKIAFLQGERKGHENLMRDLVRRIKMLEYALKNERAKMYKLQHPGKEMSFSDMKPPITEEENTNEALDIMSVANQKEESRKILRDYLREVGFPDNVLEARVARISAYRSLHSSHAPLSPDSRSDSPKPQPSPSLASLPKLPSSHPPPPSLVNGPIANGTDMQAQPSHSPKREDSPTAISDPNRVGSEEGSAEEEEEEEESALDSFNFLDEQDDSDDDEDDESGGWVQQPTTSQGLLQLEGESAGSGELDLNTESALDEFSSPGFGEAPGMEPGQEPPGTNAEAPGERGPYNEWRAEFSREVQRYKPKKKKVTARPSRSELQRMEQLKNQVEEQPPAGAASAARPSPASQPLFGMGGIMRLPGRMAAGATGSSEALPGQEGLSDERIDAIRLGPLAGLSISNESTGVFDNPVAETVKKWENKFTMRSHFDVVTSVSFHPTEHVLVTGSEDCTIKVWNLQRTTQPRRSAIVDVEPVQTFRGHRGAVLSVAVGMNGHVCFSGSADANIRVWQLPGENCDPFDVYDAEIHQGVLQGHTDAIWDLGVHPSNGLLLSCAADLTCRLWNHTLTSPQVKLFQTEQRFGNPTSVDFVHTDLHQIVASYAAAKAVVYDMETAQAVLNLDSASTYDGTCKTQINKIVCHPTLPIIVTGHEDKYIRFFDAKTGKVIHSMTAHLDAVTGLAVDPHGLYLLSSGHDGSLRFWNMDTKMCIQETTAHRKRYDEAIYNVACHSSLPYFASAGADSIAKVFV